MIPTMSPQPVYDNSGRILMIVNKKLNGFEITWLSLFTVEVSKYDIEIYPEINLRDSVRGLCGDFDGSKKYDRTGPKECLYQDDKLFAYSWTSSDGDGCNQEDENHNEDEVQKFQASCVHRPKPGAILKLPITDINEITDDECTEDIYPLKREGNKWCAGYDSTIKCKTGCVPLGINLALVKSGCWPKDETPPDVAAGEKDGYMRHPPKERAPSNITIPYKDPAKCVKKSRDDECTQTIYPLTRQGSDICAAYKSTIKCKPGCFNVGHKVDKVKTGCWPIDKTPPDVKNGLEDGYITHPPREDAPLYITFPFKEPLKCVKRT